MEAEQQSQGGCQHHHPVLVVEDDADIREAVQLILEDEGFDVVTACNGAEAEAELAHMEEPCLVLLDLMMPVMNGWEFRQEQLQDQTLAAIPTVIVTAHNRPDESARELGAASCIRKPVRPEQLLSTVGKYCN